MDTIWDTLRRMQAEIDSLKAGQGTGIAGTDQTIKGSHDRLDNLWGAGGLSVPWFNRYMRPTTPNANDAEMVAAPAGNWAWTTTPGSINGSSGVSYTIFSSWQYVYIYGNGAAQADLRCSDAGNFPRYKRLVMNVNPCTYGAGGWQFAVRSVVDVNNYIEWLVDATAGAPPTLQAWYVTGGGARTQNGASVTLYPPVALWLELGNHASADYQTWQYGLTWGPGMGGPAATALAGQRAANVAYVQLLFDQGNGATTFERYCIDYVRFSAT